MPALDTNCLLRWILGDVPEQAARVDALLGSGETIVISDVALIETVFVLEKVKKINRATIEKVVALIVGQDAVLCNRDFFLELIPVYVGHPALSFVDCYLAVLAQKTDTAPLFTFDKKLATQLPAAKLLA